MTGSFNLTGSITSNLLTVINGSSTELSVTGTGVTIGKGRPSRPFIAGGRPCGTPSKDRIILLHENLKEDEAFSLETEYILKYGRKDIDPENGLLHNRTNGGEGSSGAIRSQEFKENLSAKIS